MSSFKINGGKILSGTLAVAGSKNAVLPIICATVLTKEECVLNNVPDIADVHNLIKILKGLGSSVDESVPGKLIINNSNVSVFAPDVALVKKLRGSILLLGPLLSRFGEVLMPYPGGDLIGKRPIDVHIAALHDIGAEESENKIGEDGSAMLYMKSTMPTDAEIVLRELSVTATENAIMFAVRAKGTIKIHLAAAEPHIQDLCAFLNKCGAKISGIGGHDLIIEGVETLHGAEHSIIFDGEAACSFLNLAAATKSEITVTGLRTEFLRAPLNKFREMHVNFEDLKNAIVIRKPNQAYTAPSVKLEGMIYPGMLSDYLPPFAVLATQAEGTTLIHEHMYEGRLGYVHELIKMGAQARIIDQHRAEITGPTKLHGMHVSSLDVRSGVVMIIAALVAEGQSILHDVEHVDRGYEHIDEKLRLLGVDIIRES